MLVLGETGTGKELAAAAIHRLSARREGTFLVANAATTETLFEAEFNGNVKGFPTGASARLGWARAADGGTLCFDEIGDMPLPNQAKLLRFMQSGAIRVVGEDGPRNVNVRVIGATNKDIGSLRETSSGGSAANSARPVAERRGTSPCSFDTWSSSARA